MRLPPKVAEQGLCVRCGFCFDICPFDLINHDERFFPTITKINLHRCNQCGLCIKGCPADVDLPSLSNELFAHVPEPFDAVGVVKKVYVGYSLDRRIRSEGSSGGVVTELLLYLVRKGLVDQALVCGMREDRPWEPNPILATSEEEITQSAQSKYTIVPQMRRISQIIKSNKKTAIVGIPCQIHAYRKFASSYKKMSESVPIVIGLACHSTLEMEASQKLLELAKIKREDITKLQYRSGKAWPGGIHATLKNGEVRGLHALNVKAAFNRLALFYTPARCLTCIDFSSELADLSVMDPWVRDEKGHRPYSKGYSLIIVRNDRAEKILNQAVSDGSLFLEEISTSMLPTQFRPMAKKKKIGSPIRIEKLKRCGKPYPKYNVVFPDVTLLDRIQEKLDSMKRILGKWRLTRDLGMRFAFSTFGNYFMKVNAAIKKQKFAAKYHLKILYQRKIDFFSEEKEL